MIKHHFGADYQTLGKRSFMTREDFPVVPGLSEDDYWDLWERMRHGEGYDELRKALVEQEVPSEYIKYVMQWLDDMALRYFPLWQRYKRARLWVYISLILLALGSFITYRAFQESGQGFLQATPFLAGLVIFMLNYGKFRRLRAEIEG